MRKMILLCSWVLITSLFLPEPVCGQEIAPPPILGKYLKMESLGLVFSFRNLQDEAISKQIYRGPGIGFHSGTLQWKNDRLLRYTMDAGYSRIQSANQLEGHDITAAFSFAALHKMNGDRWQWWLGAQFDLSAQVQILSELENSFLNWNINGGTGAGVFVLSPQGGEKQSRIRWFNHFYFPVLSYVNRPKYGVVLAADQPQAHSLVAAGPMIRLTNEVGFFYTSKKKEQPFVRLSYKWSFLRWRDQADYLVVFGQHQLVVSFLFVKKMK
jgi:hypothetical protein